MSTSATRARRVGGASRPDDVVHESEESRLARRETVLRHAVEQTRAARDAANQEHDQAVAAYRTEVSQIYEAVRARFPDLAVTEGGIGTVLASPFSAYPNVVAAVRAVAPDAEAIMTRLRAAQTDYANTNDAFHRAEARLREVHLFQADIADRQAHDPTSTSGVALIASEGGRALAYTFLGHQGSLRDTLARLTNAQAGQAVSLSEEPHERLRVAYHSPGGGYTVYNISRVANLPPDVVDSVPRHVSRQALAVSGPDVRSDAKTAVSGRALLRGFRAMQTAGIAVVTAWAARDRSHNGYDTWAKIGATGPIPAPLLRAVQAQFGRGIKTVEALMDRPGGPAWWQTNGQSFPAVMDLTPQGRTGQMLDRLFARRS